MKALSIRQPWASMILGTAPEWPDRPGLVSARSMPKDIENRCWSTSYRGPLLVHAPKGIESLEYFYGPCVDQVLAELPRGVLLGCVELVRCGLWRSTSPWAEPAQYHWRLENPVAFPEPLVWRGQQGLFDVPDSVCEELFKQVEG